MPLLANTKQNKRKRLNGIEEYYLDISKDKSNSVWSERGKNMLKFVEMLNENFKKTKIWGLTSHSRLILQNEDKWDSKWFVIIEALGHEYYFEYLITDDKKPWKNATVKGVTRNLVDAKKYLLISMNESGGWNNNLELERLLKEIET
ncbi:hypothetical protein [uncultured Winogradskyella sp.]|uniref:hypothetical protein n=1 Tax=uncultured Winogradskyella sp. TaxID=395353 RepID=UPI00261FFC14|nr:hypothetical protein [uncultured Winogradskyella sp.]